MSDEKKFFPRVWVEHLNEFNCGEYAIAFPSPDDFKHPIIIPCEEYLSLQEHDHLISELKKERDNYRDALVEDLQLSSMKIQRLEKLLDCAEEALAFYGNGGNFQTDIWEHKDLGYFTGKRAKLELEKIREERGIIERK